MVPDQAVDEVAGAAPRVADYDPQEFSSVLQAASCASSGALPRQSVLLRMRQQQQQQRSRSVLTLCRDERLDHDVSITAGHTPPVESCRPITNTPTINHHMVDRPVTTGRHLTLMSQ